MRFFSRALFSVLVLCHILLLCSNFEPSHGSDIFRPLIKIRSKQYSGATTILLSADQKNDSFSKGHETNILRRKRAVINKTSKLISFSNVKRRSVNFLSSMKSRLEETIKEGCYFGLSERLIYQLNSGKEKEKGLTIDDTLSQVLLEMRKSRIDMEKMRQDLKLIQRHLGISAEEEDIGNEISNKSRKREIKKWDDIGLEVERWAEKLIRSSRLSSENNGDSGWKEIKVSRLCSNYNKDGRIKCHLKWMKDSRTEGSDDELEYPCIVVQTTLDAPMDAVCQYLSDKASLPDYNALVVKHCDLRAITPHSKICWGQTPKILFIKPRNLVTFCHHRWRRDGTQVVVNQACKHEGYIDDLQKHRSDNSNAADENCPKAYALRGANFISPHPKDPNQTMMNIVAHANPGSDISPWMCRLAVNQLVQIEPFKLFHKINHFVKRYHKTADLDSTNTDRSSRPGGLSQMGYACFWPEGGGLKEDSSSSIGQLQTPPYLPTTKIVPSAQSSDPEEVESMTMINTVPLSRDAEEKSNVVVEI
mmetsp:Transcript_4319/g.4763  ORF Transcript_4319/g.4763 Transcript_4319/m.4763 type:complete len:533 (+) Transcript_4319:204-1802(+)